MFCWCSFFIPTDGRSNINLPSDWMLGVKICRRVAASPPVSRLDGGGADGASFEAVEGVCGVHACFAPSLIRCHEAVRRRTPQLIRRESDQTAGSSGERERERELLCLNQSIRWAGTALNEMTGEVSLPGETHFTFLKGGSGKRLPSVQPGWKFCERRSR